MKDVLREVYSAALLASGTLALLRHARRHRAVILMYHALREDDGDHAGLPLETISVSVRAFTLQLRYVRKHYNVISLTQLVDAMEGRARIPERALVITFDDGYMNNYTLAFPLLRRFGVPATVFLATEFVDRGTPFWWDLVRFAVMSTRGQSLNLDINGRESLLSLATAHERGDAGTKLIERLGQLNGRGRESALRALCVALDVDPARFPIGDTAVQPLTWRAVREMALGGIEFGSHTVSHAILPRCDSETLAAELEESRAIIEKKVGASCRLFCYPNGDLDIETRRAVMKAGYRCAVTAVPGMVSLDDDPYLLKRMNTRWRMLAFKSVLAGGDPVYSLRTDVGWN